MPVGRGTPRLCVKGCLEPVAKGPHDFRHLYRRGRQGPEPLASGMGGHTHRVSGLWTWPTPGPWQLS